MKNVLAVVVALINAGALACTISGETIQSLAKGTAGLKLLITLFAVFAIIQLILAWLIARKIDVRHLKEDTKKFIRFFSSWYKAEGLLYVFCSDVEWLEGDNNQSIVDELCRKGKAGRVYLVVRRTDSPRIREFIRAGVKVYIAPSEVKLRTRMSLRIDDDHRSLIIRTVDPKDTNGRSSRQVAIVRSTSDDRYCGLAEDMFALCCKGQPISAASIDLD